MLNVLVFPVHPLAVAVTVILATTGVFPELMPANDVIFPVPEAARPIDGLSLVQV